MATAAQEKTPGHLWAVGVISLLWNCVGAFDYTATKLKLVAIPPEMQALLDATPVWFNAAWAFGVWGSLLGSALLLARSRYAVLAFAVSLAGLLVSTWYQQAAGFPMVMPLMGTIWLILLVLFVYSVRMRRAGVLR